MGIEATACARSADTIQCDITVSRKALTRGGTDHFAASVTCLSDSDKWRWCIWAESTYRWTHGPCRLAWSEAWHPLWAEINRVNSGTGYDRDDSTLFHYLLLRSYLYHYVWSVITAHNLTPEKRDPTL